MGKIANALVKKPHARDGISKTKVGGTILGVATILTGAGKYLVGDMDIFAMLQTIALGVGEILIACGVRDAL